MRVALTGAASGIGAQVAAKLATAGHTVTAFDIVEPAGVDHWIAVDMGDPNSIDAAILAAQGPFDALVNNAGLPPREGQAEQVLRVNWFGLETFLNGMLDKLAPGASVVNTASRAGSMWRENLDEVKALMALDIGGLAGFLAERGIDATRAYNLSKEAVIVMTMMRTQDMLARGMRMNSVSPSAVSTGILDDFLAAFGPGVAKNVARAGRPGLPEEVADLILFLLSPQSYWVKGQDILVDGGLSAMITSETLGLTKPT